MQSGVGKACGDLEDLGRAGQGLDSRPDPTRPRDFSLAVRVRSQALSGKLRCAMLLCRCVGCERCGVLVGGWWSCRVGGLRCRRPGVDYCGRTATSSGRARRVAGSNCANGVVHSLLGAGAAICSETGSSSDGADLRRAIRRVDLDELCARICLAEVWLAPPPN